MVHVKKVEIFGFKSFGFKNTTVNFEPGLISISGPNGSGKSNILDAIIFATGENRPTAMRVPKLLSLIHDIEGASRGPKMARSSVHFDNSDRKIPVDTDAVVITRELNEQGENTYYLNKKKTNRSHVLDLLDVANAGLGELNAIQQGTVTRISEYSSEEKRKKIEDMIGLSYFDEKKTEAEKQLETADRRLEIALAKMGEIKNRIDELEEERNQKMRHELLERELGRYHAVSAANKLKSVSALKSAKESDLQKRKTEITILGEERSILRSEIESLKSEKSRLMTLADDHTRAKSAFDSEFSSVVKQYDADNNAISASRKRFGQIESRIPEIHLELDEIRVTQNENNAQISQAKESLDETVLRRNKINDDLQAVNSQRDKILAEQSEAAAKKSEIDGKMRSLTDQLNDAKLSLLKIQHKRDESEIKIKTNSEKLADAKGNMTELSGHLQKLESIMGNHKASVDELESRIKKLHARKAKIGDDMDELGLILEKSTKAATQYESKIKTVKGFMPEDYTVAKLKEDADQLGIEGLVYDLISWDKKFERSILAVSSDWIKAIVVKDFATLLGIAEVTKRKNLPKLRIIPLDAIPKLKMNTPKGSGILGVLSDCVKCDDAYLTLRTFLFGNIVLTETRESAYAISQNGYKAVTIDGEYFEASGGTVVIDINSKISKLTKLISMSGDIDGLLRSIGLIKKYMQKKKHTIKKLEDSIQSGSDRLSMSEKSLISANEQHTSLKSNIDITSGNIKHLQDRIFEMQSRHDIFDSETLTHESHVDSLNERITIMDENYADGEQTRIASELSQINLKKSEADRRQTEIIAEFAEKSGHLTTLKDKNVMENSKLNRLDDEEASLRVERQDLLAGLRTLGRQIESKNESLTRLRQKEQELIAESGSSIGRLKEFDDKLGSASDRDRELTRQINSIERQTDLLNHDLEDLIEDEAKLRQILTASGFDETMETFDVDAIVQSLESELRSLDALNAKAPETYLDVSFGYRSMSTRKNSLEEERNSIVKFIEGVEKDKRQTFLDAFDRVDKEIRAIFNKMTGGNAWLELQNEDDIFASGISYLIQFPNKPKRESASISGGEKTLAAIVFVLALQRLKPSPFYLFDEVDAHLDAPNSERLSNILAERAKDSQFIMVSLKESVIKRAKMIYGVFPKNGVSNVVYSPTFQKSHQKPRTV